MVGPSGRFSNFPWLGDSLRLLFGVPLRSERQPRLLEIPLCEAEGQIPSGRPGCSRVADLADRAFATNPHLGSETWG
jgi:hypothetical protein